MAAKEQNTDPAKPQQSDASGPPFISWTWWNQKLARFLGDVEEPPTMEGKTPVRAGCRIIFIILLLAQFLTLLIYYYKKSPDVEVQQIYELSLGKKNHQFPITKLYDLTPDGNTSWRDPIICPCNNISISWRNLVNFYFVHSNSTVWNVSFGAGSTDVSPSIIVPYFAPENMSLLIDHIVLDPTPVTAESFCSKSNMWPITDSTTQSVIDGYNGAICEWLATSVFPGDPSFQDKTRSSQIMESPNLLNREILNMNVAALARATVLERRLKIDMANQNSKTLLQEYYNGLSNLLTGLLDRDETEPYYSYWLGALDAQATLDTEIGYDWAQPLVFITEDANGTLLFLHPEIDWMGYYQACAPKYCDVTFRISTFRQVYRAVGLLGGVTSIVLGITSVLLWPTTAKVLKHFEL